MHLVGGEKNSGAFRGANLLNNDLKSYGVNSEIIYENRTDFINIIGKKIRQNFDKSPKIFFPRRENSTFSSSLIGINFLKDKKYLNADIVNLHWINKGFFNISDLKKINKPIVWTLRDMWLFTGGCHYTLGCNNFENKCKKCPQLNSNLNYDLSTFNQLRKKKYLKKKNINFVVNSTWMERMAKKSSLLKDEVIHTFFPSFDLKNFYSDYDANFKSKLSINNRKKIILYGAQNIEAKYKGFDYFLNCLDYLEKDKYLIIFFGHLWNENVLKKKNIEYLKMGFIKDDNILRKLYSISDVFVASSLQEGFPKTVAESLLCRTPLVYFKDTSIEDVCKNKLIGGYGANYCDSEDLANGIKWVINNPENSKKLAVNGAMEILTKFNSESLIKKYVNLYQKLIN